MKAIPVPPRRAVILIAFVAAIFLLVWLLWQQSRQLALPPPESLSLTTSFEPISPIPDVIPHLDQKKVALGNALFLETSLSRDDTIACASCHQLTRGGVDGVKNSIGVKGQASGINTPTVFNSGFNFRQFWNGRAKTLEEQAAGPIHNALEMGSSWTEVIAKLRRDPAYVAAFSQSYRNGITSVNISDAIATFVRSLITPNSRFDKYLKGDINAITPYELSGYELFTSYGCIACHQGMNVGGNMYQKLGIMRDYFKERGGITEADLGRYVLTKNSADMHVFKVPGLRNIALTAPYLHDGAAQSLEDVVRIMGKYQLGITLPNEDVSMIYIDQRGTGCSDYYPQVKDRQNPDPESVSCSRLVPEMDRAARWLRCRRRTVILRVLHHRSSQSLH